MMGTLASIDAGLKALGVPHGRGALEAASRVIAGEAREARVAPAARARPADPRVPLRLPRGTAQAPAADAPRAAPPQSASATG